MAGIDYTLGMKTSGFDSGVSSALGKLASISSKVAGIAAASGLVAGIGVAAFKSIGKAAEMEGLETAFIPLLGSVKAAKDRMAELADFAANTPFELPGVAAASKTLETLTRGGLSTGKGLTLVGDVASGTNTQFEEMAVTIGRLYDGLDSGRPVGEALARLQELGAISGETRAKLEAMQAEGRKGAEVWAIAEDALGRFSGSMKLQSGTWNGLMSTLQDSISMLMAKFGEPIMDSLKPYLDGAIARVESFQSAAVAAGQAIGNALQLGMAAFQEGKLFEVAGQALKVGFLDAVNTLAKGIMASGMAIGAAIQQSNLQATVSLIFEGIAAKFSARILDTLSNVPGLGGLKEDAAAYNTVGDVMFAAGKGVAMNLNPGAGMEAAMAKFNEALGTLPDMIDSTGARADLDASLATVRDRAAKNAEEAAAKQAAIVDSITQKTIAAPSGIAEAAAARTSGGAGPREADRLAQIGLFVGRGNQSIGEKVAEKTAQWTQRAAEGIAKLVDMNRSSTLQPVGGSLF